MHKLFQNISFNSFFICTILLSIFFPLVKKAQSVDPVKKFIQIFPTDPSTPFISTPVSILFAGDTHFEWGIRKLTKEKGYKYPAAEMKSLFLGFDFRILNLETTITNYTESAETKSYIFRSEPESISLLDYLGINLAVLGNNHTMDMGKIGLDDTISNLREYGISSVGAGKNLSNAVSPYYFSLRNITFAVLSCSEIGTDSLFAKENSPGVCLLNSKLYNAIHEAKNKADHVIVSVHWGLEYDPLPQPKQSSMARAFIDAGASVVVGHHPHVPQGVELYKNGVIVYSLGNFLFGSYNYYQTDNYIAGFLFNSITKKLETLQIIPINGRYYKYGHRVNVIQNERAESFWKRFLVMNSLLNKNNFLITIQKNGIGNISIEGD